MKNAIKNFWIALLSKINDKINGWLNAPKNKIPTADAGDDTIVNFFAMVLKKVLNRALMGRNLTLFRTAPAPNRSRSCAKI